MRRDDGSIRVQGLSAGNHAISAPVTAQGGLTLDAAAGSSVTFTGPVTTADASIQVVKSGPGQVTLSNTLSHGGSVTVTGGNLTLNGTAKLTGGGTLTVASGASATIATTPTSTPQVVLNSASPVVNDGGVLQLSQTGDGLSRSAHAQNVAVVSNLIIGFNGTFDLADNDLIVHVPDQASFQGTLDAYRFVVNRWLTSGQYGLTSSTADALAASAGHRVTTLAVFPNYVPAYDTGYFTSYDGVSLGKYDLVVKYAYVGDINLDGVLDGKDFKVILQNAVLGVSGGWDVGDLNYDGVVNGDDLAAFAAVYGTTGSNSLGSYASEGGGTAAIPEPATASLLCLFSGACLTSRRRR
jgi:hypothetical protein